MRGLYIHIPFCKNKCPYCDFNSYQDKLSLSGDYVDRLLKEADGYKDEKIDTIYIGGGTPSLLSEELIKKLLDGIYGKFIVDKNAEITIEVNPGTVTKSKLETYRKTGINRLSVGVQSFDDEMLKILGRIHDGNQAERVIKSAFETGFKNVSADLMFSYLGQTKKAWQSDLEKAEKLSLVHISCYSLKVEKGTPFYKNKMENLDEDSEIELQEYMVEYLKSIGLKRYEISNFAKEGYESRHNMHYWKCDEYIGLGAGAHSYYKDKRFNNILSPEKYISSDTPAENIVVLSDDDKQTEKFIMGMRLSEGVDEKFARNMQMVQKYTQLGFIKKVGENISFTDKGFNISNYILSDII